MRSVTAVSCALAAGLVGGCQGGSSDEHQREGLLGGATFTTVADGTSVNENRFDTKPDVCIDGGPGPNAPSGAAALPAGEYYFQVTDPSGTVLLSQDGIECRRVTINAAGTIVALSGDPSCAHITGTDVDHAHLGAITIQLMPYANSPNNGDEYKVWVTPVSAYRAYRKDEANQPNFGFVEADSKTDNFKVKHPGPRCGDGFEEGDEECDDCNTTSGDGCSATCHEEPRCGDGEEDPGEDCDDGNTANGDGCSATCEEEDVYVPSCGDDMVNAGEECDDGNTANGDGCSATCEEEDVYVPSCGDDMMNTGEQCDDGNTTSGDGCSATCQLEKVPYCGDAYVDYGEQCDDGNLVNGDGCSTTCRDEYKLPPTGPMLPPVIGPDPGPYLL